MIDTKSYGQALFSLANENGKHEKILEELNVIKELFDKNPELADVLDTPALQLSEKLSIAQDVFGGFDEYTVNFLKILCEEHSVYLFPKCVKSYTECADETFGILRVTALTATEMSDSQLSALKAKLGTMTGKNIVLSTEIDTSIIAGVKIRYSGVQLDGSVKTRLEELRQSLAETIV